MVNLSQKVFRPFAGSSRCSVGVCFEPSSVSLAVRRGRRLAAPVRRELPERAVSDGSFSARAADYHGVLSELVEHEGAAGAKCAVSLPVARCRFQSEFLPGARVRDLRDAVRHSAFWQARLGVALDGHRTWWRFARDHGGVNALLVAAPIEDVEFCENAVRAAGLAPGVIGVSCFDYFDAAASTDAARVVLTLDVNDACLVAVGAFGLRAHAVAFDDGGADALCSADSRTRDAVVDGLAACVQRAIEDERAVVRPRAEVRVIAARALHGDWLESLRERLPGFPVERVDGWTAAGLTEPDEPDGTYARRLPRAAACLAGAARSTLVVNFANDDVGARRFRRWQGIALLAAASALLLVSVCVHWLLLEERWRLEPVAEQYERVLSFYERARAEIETLREHLSRRVLFYSAIQHISFERKLMPRLLALIEEAAPEGVWLNAIHFKRPDFLRIAGKSPDDERIARFIQRLRTADEITDAVLESAVVETTSTGRPAPTDHSDRRGYKDFVVICRLRVPEGGV